MSKIIEEFKALPNDVEKWKWLIGKQGLGLKVVCDNDQTSLVDEVARDKADDECLDYEDLNIYADFNGYIGWSSGVFSLLDAIGIDAESC